MWLLALAVKQAIEQAYHNGVLPTAEQQIAYEARYGLGEGGDFSRVLTMAGDVAEISVSGVITKSPSFIAMLFGGGNVTYPEIISALAEADKNPEVKRAELRIDSPGGHFDGLFDAIAAIQSFSKPLRAVVSNQAASAAYALASQADEIVATNRAARVGSIGIVGSFQVDDTAVDISSTNAPKKRPDPTTESGKAAIREELDAMHSLFVESIADGRSTSPEKVNAEYGQGATLLADEALKRGMIDAIAEAPLRVVKSTKSTTTARSGGNNPEIGPMDLNTLKAQHPDVYAAAVQEGVTNERDRVSAHLTMGEASGDMTTALAAVNDGSIMTASLQAKYMAAGMNRRDQQNRQDDDGQASAAADGAQGEQGGEDAADQVLALVETQLGIVGE